MAKKFRALSEREILALAVSLEEEDGRVYGEFADGLRETYPDTAKIFDSMREEESQHRVSLIETYRNRFGEHIPLIRRQDVKGFVQRRPIWLARPLRIDDVLKQVEVMELESRRFYERAIQHVGDAGVRKLLGDLAEVERRHYATAESLQETITPTVQQKEEDAQRRLFVLQIVQPGLAGLMGSVSTLAPVFAALDCVRGGPGGVGGSRHFHGFCRGAVRRWVAHRPRAAHAARLSHRADDRGRRNRAHATVPHSGFPPRDDLRGGRGGCRARSHQLHSSPLHGRPAPLRGLSSGPGGRAGVPDGNSDRSQLSRLNGQQTGVLNSQLST